MTAASPNSFLPTSDARYDVVAIGNAIVDVIADATDEFIVEEQLVKGGMTLIDAARATELYGAMGVGREISGGSAANTLAGLSMLGRQCAFVGQVAADQLGDVFTHDIRAVGIDYDVPPRATGGESDVPTARCLILVTPDGQRTMNTFLGATQYLPADALDEALIRDASILYLEGYLWDPEEPRAAMRRAIDIAKKAGRKVAFTLSDAFVIDRYRADFMDMINAAEIDILFANEVEIASLAENEDFEAAVAAIAAKVPLLVVTRGAHGAICLGGGERAETFALPIEHVVDTTGAGDQFAAGFLAGLSEGRALADCLKMGAICAHEVISHYGARPETDLRALVDGILGEAA